MKKISFLFIFLTILGCANKEVKIPTLPIKGLQELHNHSQVWMFLDIKKNDTIANVNRKNTISTTHWIFNIDKRLPLKAIIPSIITLQDKHANSIHSEEGMHNYFSYADTISNQLSFFEFDNTTFKTDSTLSKYYIKENSKNYKNYNNINLTFNINNIWINDAKIDFETFKTTLLEFIDFSSEGKQTMLHLNFNQQLSYQQYLYFRTLIQTFASPGILINHVEFIFNQNKVPDCGCE